MPSIKDIYEAEIIEKVVGAKLQEEAKKAPPSPFDHIKIKAPVLPSDEKNVKWFSALFWKPTTIKDIPIRVFKDTDWPVEARVMIPKVNTNWVWNREVTEEFALAMYCGDTTLLYGLQGTGKSCTAEQWCAMLRIPFWRQSCNRETREVHFLGNPGVSYDNDGKMRITQEPTLLTDSLKYGGMFVEDEAFRHNSALVLQSLREKTNRSLILPDAPGRTAEERVLKAIPHCWWYVLTDNTAGSGDETGMFDAEVQDASTLDRIDVAIEVPYLGKPQERKILQNHSNLDVAVIDPMLDFIKLVRNAFSKQDIMTTISVRGMLAWADKTELTGSLEKGLRLSWYNKLCKDDQAVVRDMYHQVFARTL